MTSSPLPLREAAPGQEPPFEGSLWLLQQALIDDKELDQVIKALGAFHIFRLGCVCKKEEGYVEKEQFLDAYSHYISHLKKSDPFDDTAFRLPFTTAWTTSTDCLYGLSVNEKEHIIKVCRPVLFLQLHRMHYSTVDGKFRSNLMSKEGISWGLQFSYPQLFYNPETKKVEKTNVIDLFPNTHLYRQLQRLLRHYSVPVAFEGHKGLQQLSVRLGKTCYSWIHHHPDLLRLEIKVKL